jgi:hypothetical protein
MLAIDAAAGLALAITTLWFAYCAACLLCRQAGTAVRATAAAVTLSWTLSVALLVLSPPRLFVRGVVILGWCMTAVLTHRLATRRVDLATMWKADRENVSTWWRLQTRPFRIVIGVGAGCVLVRLVHGLLAPCLTWDALTYHLYKPAMWVQAGAMISTAGPDAAGYYAWFPPYGDAVWGWWLLAMRGDTFIAPIAIAQFLMILVGAYAAARALGAPLLRSTAAALAIGFTPAVLNLAAAIYVDNFVVALWVAGVLFLVRAFERPAVEDAVLASAAFAILAGVKGSVLPISGLGILAALATMRTVRASALVLLTAIPAAVPSLLAWHATGSPLYPLTLNIGGRSLFPGNSELEWLLRAGWMTPQAMAEAQRLLFGRLFFPWERLNTDFFNLGLGMFCLVPAAIVGSLSFLARRSDRAILAFLLISALVSVGSVAGDANIALRLWWWGLLGRLVMVAVAAAVLVAAKWDSRWSTVCLWLCAALGLVVGWPRGTSIVDLRAFVTFLPALVSGGIAVVIMRRLRGRPRIVVAALTAVALVAALSAVRDRFRYAFYDAAAKWRSYDTHPIDARWTASWPIWEHLDVEPGATIAVAAGWDGIGHNWYRYPVMGRRLQNRLIYVPITNDGSFVDYGSDRRPTNLSCQAWLKRLAAAGATHFLLLPPLPYEDTWIRSLPGVFVPEMALKWPGTAVYRISSQKIHTASCATD